jgi:threonine dehydrogenase-like Zn-dependent dehydrogenase
VVAVTGARRHKPLLGPDVLTGGFPLVYDCVGSPESVRDALTYVRSQGAVVMVGNAGILPKFDITWVWAKEISIIGSYFYAPEPLRGGRHTLELTLDHLASDGARGVERLVTHSFALERYQEAVVANIERNRFKSIKTIFKPRS